MYLLAVCKTYCLSLEAEMELIQKYQPVYYTNSLFSSKEKC